MDRDPCRVADAPRTHAALPFVPLDVRQRVSPSLALTSTQTLRLCKTCPTRNVERLAGTASSEVRMGSVGGAFVGATPAHHAPELSGPRAAGRGSTREKAPLRAGEAPRLVGSAAPFTRAVVDKGSCG